MTDKNLFPVRYEQKDFFICDVFDSFKDDLASMEHPIFSLSKKPDHRLLSYSSKNGTEITIKPSYTGLATIFDKDILLYLASALMRAKNDSKPTTKTIRFSSYDYLVSTNKSLGGRQYSLLREGLERLSGTRIQTNIKTNGLEITKEFGLIEGWTIIKEDKKEKAIAIEVNLSTWFYNSILGNEVLTIDKKYFRLRKPTERRLYELARKHCGKDKPEWKIKLTTLKEKLGVTSQIKLLRFGIKKIAESNHLPGYHISIADDMIYFNPKGGYKRKSKKTGKNPSREEVNKAARPGESYDDVFQRLKSAKP